MRTPFFWYKPQGFCSAFLWTFEWLYAQGIKGRAFYNKTYTFPIPIISIGNIVCGGAGKTPTAIALAQLLQKKKYNVHFVTRGYNGKAKGPLLVNSSSHDAHHVGDEPLLLARYAPTWIARKRGEGVLRAIEHGADLIILDDGHQTHSLSKAVSLIVIDSHQGFGNECLIPAGPLRESIPSGISRADAIIHIGMEGIVVNTAPPAFHAQMIPQPLDLPSRRVVAFCALGFPEKFYRSLRDAGFELTASESFPDHHHYTEKDLIRLQQLAERHQSVLVTTQKDFVKIPPSWQKNLYVLDVNIHFNDPEGLCNFILEKIYPLKENS